MELMIDLSTTADQELDVLSINPNNAGVREHQLSAATPGPHNAADRGRRGAGHARERAVAPVLPRLLRLVLLAVVEADLRPRRPRANLEVRRARPCATELDAIANSPNKRVRYVVSPDGHRSRSAPPSPGEQRPGRPHGGDVAAERGLSAFDTMCDIAVADGLRTTFWTPWVDQLTARLRCGPRCCTTNECWSVGPMRAHTSTACAGQHTHDVPRRARPRARGHGARGRRTSHDRRPGAVPSVCTTGGLRQGCVRRASWCSSPAAVAADRIVNVADLPGGAERLASAAIGIEHVLVNGTPIVTNGALTGERPGVVLRAGHDTGPIHA